MGYTVILAMLGLSLAAGVPIDCDQHLGSNAGVVIPSPVGDYVNININDHYPTHISNGNSGQDGVPVSGGGGHFTHHGTNVFLKPQIILSPGNTVAELPFIPIISGNQKFGGPQILIPQAIPEFPLVASEPDPLIVQAAEIPIIRPVVEDPKEEVYNNVPIVIPPAPELPPLQLPTRPVPIVLEEKPEPLIIPAAEAPIIRPVLEDPIEEVYNNVPFVIPPAPELPPFQLPTLPVPVVLEEKPIIGQVPQPHPEPSLVEVLPEPLLVLPLPESPLIRPVASDFVEEVNRTPLVIPPAPELPPLQLPILPVPILTEENLNRPVVENTQAPVVEVAHEKVDEPCETFQDIGVLIPGNQTTSPVHVIHEEPPNPIITPIVSNNIEIPHFEPNVPNIASPGINLQPFIIAEYPQYPMGVYPLQVGSQKEIIVQPCPESYQQPGLMQIHQYVQGLPHVPLSQIIQKK